MKSSRSERVAVADGLAYATTLEGASELSDPAGQTAYAVHPYFHQANLTPVFGNRSLGGLRFVTR